MSIVKLIIVSLVTMAVGSVALAQSDIDRSAGPSLEDMQAFANARLAALKARLALTEEQAKNWPAFEQALQEWQKLRADRVRQRADRRGDYSQSESTTPAEGLRQRATVMTETGASLKKLADALEIVYNGLDESQKRRFDMLSRIGTSEVLDRDDRLRGFRGSDNSDYRDDRDDYDRRSNRRDDRGRDPYQFEDYRR